MEKVLNSDDALVSDTGTIYEVSYLLLPSITTEDILDKSTSIKEMLVSSGATIISLETPVLIDLSYSMTKVVQTSRYKCDTAYFGWVKFEMTKDTTIQGGGIEAVKKFLDASPDVLRYLIIKTVRENTLLNGKMKLQKEDKSKREEDETSLEVVDVEKEVISKEIDKSIDDLVVV